MSKLTPITSPLLSGLPGIRHAFFTREGGVSVDLYRGLNTGLGSGDAPDAVARNRALAADWFGLGPEALMTCYQIHSPIVHDAAQPWDRKEGDGVVASAPGLICGVLAADCAPVLIADPEARIVAAAHAGWKPALSGVVEAAVARMVELGASRDRLVAAVGPCIAQASYEVGADFLDRFEREDPGSARFFAPGADATRRMFDLPGYVLGRIVRAGISRAEWTGHDTYDDEARFFSNRRALHKSEPDYGRLLSAIALT